VDNASLTGALKAALIVSVSDGQPGPEEYRALSKLIEVHPALGKLGDLRTLLVEVWREVKADGVEVALERAAATVQGREHRELAFRLAATVMRADGRIESEEAMALGDLQAAFDLSPEDVRRLLATTG
jgi:tellurite resistance protein